MKIVIDSNILFSALLKADAKLAEIILNPSFRIESYSCYFLYIELFKHKEKKFHVCRSWKTTTSWISCIDLSEKLLL